MSTIGQFTGKQNDIIELLMRGEGVDEIASKVHTTCAYVYNVRLKARKSGIIFPSTKRRLQPKLDSNSAPTHPTTTIPFTPHYQDNPEDIAEAYRYIDYIAKTYPPPPPPPKRDILEELPEMPLQNLKTLMQMYPYAIMLQAMAKVFRN